MFYVFVPEMFTHLSDDPAQSSCCKFSHGLFLSSMNGALLYNKELLDDNDDYIYNGESFDILYIIDYNSLGLSFKFNIF